MAWLWGGSRVTSLLPGTHALPQLSKLWHDAIIYRSAGSQSYCPGMHTAHGPQEHDYFNPVAVMEHSLQYCFAASRRESVSTAEAFYGVNPQILW